MSHHPNVPVEIPDDLDDVIRQGIDRGKKVAAHRRRVRRAAARTVCSLALVLGIFVGGINLSPAFAATVENVPPSRPIGPDFRQEPSRGGGRLRRGRRRGPQSRWCVTKTQS